MAQQLTFDWPNGIALGPEDFFVSAANEAAFSAISAPAMWPLGKLALTGPEGAGKSHLARVFAANQPTQIWAANDLHFDALPTTAIVVEDMEQLPADGAEPMFHLHNHLAAAGLPLLMTSRTPPARWDIALPDLASRMQATNIAHISEPDDALMQALLMKLFADRQLRPNPDVISYLATRIERSFAAANSCVAKLDAVAMIDKRAISIPFVRSVLDKSL